MRSIGQLPTHAAAASFSDFLVLDGIENRVEANGDGSFEVWVIDEELMARALAYLTAFQSNPTDPRFLGKSKPAQTLRAKQQREREEPPKSVHTRADILRSTRPFGIGPLSGFLLLACGIVFLLTERGENPEVVSQFTISKRFFQPQDWLSEVWSGEFWRLFTPALLHFGWIHLICNSLWIISLGSLLEARLGTLYLLGFVLVTAVVPNLAQFLVTHSPFFGGMSGVTFAMAGYAWQRGKHDPSSGIGLESQNVTMMMIYFVLCWMEQFHLLGRESLFGIGSNVANVVHTAGLGIGCLWGFLDGKRPRSR